MSGRVTLFPELDDQRQRTMAKDLQTMVDAGRIAGAVTLLWRRDAEPLVTTVGRRDVERDLPMARDTIFRIASMTKPITTVAAMMLVDEGRLSLDDPVTAWLPEFKAMRVLRTPDGPLDDVAPARREITVEDLMTHRSGLAYAFSAVGPIARAYETALGEVSRVSVTPEEWLAALGELPLLHQPGDRMHYGHSTEVLGYLVERVSGVGFHEFLRRRIFDPLGMRDTAFHVPEPEADRLANVYRSEAGCLERVDIPIPVAPPVFCAGGGMLVSTVDDYLAFARLLLDDGAVDGHRLLSAQGVAAMRANRLTPRQRAFPFLGNPYWAGMGFGLGLGVVTDPARHAWMGPGNPGAFTWPGVWGTWWQADPAIDTIMIYMIQNQSPPGAGVVTQASGGRLQTRPGLPIFQQTVYGPVAGWGPTLLAR